ncbi:MAG: hypothetical protein ABIH66_01200 [bacterium]
MNSIFSFSSENGSEPLATLSKSSPVWESTFDIKEGGESFLVLKLSSPDTSWQNNESKSVVLKVSADGEGYADIILFGGPEGLEYTSYAGTSSPGVKKITVEFDSERSPAPDARAIVHSAEMKTFGKSDKNHLVYKYSPLVYPRDGSATDDIPLLLYCNSAGDSQVVSLEYQVVFSNEDGGTGGHSPILMAQWGRTTDIEWAYQAKISRKTGKLIYETYQGEKHSTNVFTGRKINGHPVLRTATRNNNFDQAGEEAIIIGLMPLIFEQGDSPREVIMDLHPWTHRIANEEMFAEKKAVESSFGKYYEMGDARNYVYIDYNGRNNKAKRTLEFMIKLRGENKWYTSDPDIFNPLQENPGKLDRSGSCRTNVEVPPGTLPERIEKIRLNGTAGVDFEIFEIKTFFLDENYVRQPDFFTFKGDIHLTDDNNRIDLNVE